jgi:hypothetical protein
LSTGNRYRTCSVFQIEFEVPVLRAPLDKIKAELSLLDG